MLPYILIPILFVCKVLTNVNHFTMFSWVLQGFHNQYKKFEPPPMDHK